MARVIEEREVPVADPAYVGFNPLARIVYAIAAIIEAILILRLIFRALGANPTNGFVSWIYSISSPLIRPFVGVFSNGVTTSLSQARLEVPTIIAIVVYALIAWVLAMLFSAFTPRRAV